MTEKMENVGYSTIDEIINDILQVLSLEYQEKIKEMSIDDFRDIEHFNFGQWIRKKYFYQNPAKEQLNKSLGGLEKNYMLLDDNRFSHIILEALWKKSQLKANNNHEMGSPAGGKDRKRESSTNDMTRQFLF
jgi:hypothetical protein